MSFDDTHHVSILKWKQGEYRALRTLMPDVKKSITPLIEIVPPQENDAREAPPLGAYLKNVVEQVADNWGPERILVDVRFLPGEMPEGGAYPLTRLCDYGREHFVPVTWPGAPNAIVHAARRAHRLDRHGVSLRVPAEGVIASASFPDDIRQTLADLDAHPRDADFILDLGYIEGERRRFVTRIALSAIERLPHLDTWRSFTLAGTAFPPTFSHRGMVEIPRGEWMLWNEVCAALRGGTRLPSFGDYNICHPDLPNGVRRGSAHIRYTAEKTWIVPRGDVLKDKLAFGQYRSLSRDLSRHEAFAREPASWGDRYIAECAAGIATTGNQTTWRQVGVSHHLTFVVRQLARRAAALRGSGPSPA